MSLSDHASATAMRERPGFLPDPARARTLSGLMRSDLAKSLDYICEEIGTDLAFDRPAVAALIAGLGSGSSFGFRAFAHYFDLVPAIERGDTADVERSLSALARLRPQAPGVEVVSIGDPAFASVRESIVRNLDSDPTITFDFLDPLPRQAAEFRLCFTEAMSLLDAIVPDLAGEIRALIETVIVAVGDPDASHQFDGASAYGLWGALVLNGGLHKTPVDLAEAIAHESGHALLFGLTVEEPLTTNDPAAVFSSPLRRDPRPMDGIVHATFVSARMHWAMSEFARSERLSQTERANAANAAAEDAENFHAGCAVIERHGKLNPAAKAMLESAKDYMDRAVG